MKQTTTAGALAERTEHRRNLEADLANERRKLPAAEKRIAEIGREIAKLTPVADVLRRFADAGDVRAKLEYPATRARLDRLIGQRESWTAGIADIHRRIGEAEAEIGRLDAERVDSEADRAELAKAFAEIDAERGRAETAHRSGLGQLRERLAAAFGAPAAEEA